MSASGRSNDGAASPGCSMVRRSFQTFFLLTSSLSAPRAACSCRATYNASMKLLGGLAPRTFLRRHWQKRPLLVRGALPGFAGTHDLRALAALAARDDVESRMVKRRGAQWDTAYGPFSGEITLRKNSTLLV